MSVNQKRIKQLLDAEAAAAAKRKRQKEEQAKEEARMRKQSDRICPQLYDEWWGSGNLQYRKSDVIAVHRWAQQWQSYECDSWLQRTIGGY